MTECEELRAKVAEASEMLMRACVSQVKGLEEFVSYKDGEATLCDGTIELTKPETGPGVSASFRCNWHAWLMDSHSISRAVDSLADLSKVLGAAEECGKRRARELAHIEGQKRLAVEAKAQKKRPAWRRFFFG